ncbi:MAG: hypothetical protein NZ866_00205 [Patescibacteria group bacterium]|nr:hypothetical protein [Patescibacteria group bacterium]
MEFLKEGQATLIFLMVIFLLCFTFLILIGFILSKEINMSKLVILNAKMFYGQLSVLNLSLKEIFTNDYLENTEKSFVNDEINSYFNLPEINPEVKSISGNITTKSINFPLEWKFNFTLEKDNQGLKNLRIFILD